MPRRLMPERKSPQLKKAAATRENRRLSDLVGEEALETLRLMLTDDDVADSSRVSAAKALLERFLPAEDDEARQRDAEERTASIAEAQCLLAELALAKFGGISE